MRRGPGSRNTHPLSPEQVGHGSEGGPGGGPLSALTGIVSTAGRGGHHHPARADRLSDYPRAVPAPSQRRALGALFLLIAIAFAGVAWAGFAAGGGAIVVGVAAAALAVWMATMAFSGFRR